MKRIVWLVLFMVAVVLAGGDAAWGQGDFYVIAGGGRVGTRISSVPYTISKSGFYFLGGDLTRQRQRHYNRRR